jgi:DNA helicase IV
VADVALIDDLAARLGAPREAPREERAFYEIEELDDVARHGVSEVGQRYDAPQGVARGYEVAPHSPRERLLRGRLEAPAEYAHVLIDEAQDFSPMQWRMLGRRGRWSSWTVVGDAAQAAWPDPEEARQAREEAFGSQQRSLFHMDTNYRNAREIFDYAAAVIRTEVPDADIPQAVRETGVQPRDLTVGGDTLSAAVTREMEALLEEVEGSVAVIAPARWETALATLSGDGSGRVVVVDPMSTKGLEYDATVVVDPDEITRESPGGIRVLYVALTRAAHRMTVVRPS